MPERNFSYSSNIKEKTFNEMFRLCVCVCFLSAHRSSLLTCVSVFNRKKKKTDTCTRGRQMIRDDFLFHSLLNEIQLAIFYYPRKVSHIINDFLSRAKNWKFTRCIYRHYRLVKYNCCSDVGTNLNHKSDPFLWSAKEERAYCTGQSHVINNLLLIVVVVGYWKMKL